MQGGSLLLSNVTKAEVGDYVCNIVNIVNFINFVNIVNIVRWGITFAEQRILLL